ncbi:hypothetical protein CARUB_v10019827mg [Capsella rubella]|uniref:Phorbol-ester/DAG-type domain-containing protein n=1 Tax=Capsella rubella TaxID=81985 RepID=R0IAN5_9BRAS|nr:hypothetical protein CARUB_v10019827mg [Capsella rubella]
MDSIGGFHELESQFVYHHPKYNPIPHTQKSDKAFSSHDHSFQPLYLCPLPRSRKEKSDSLTYPVSYSPEYVGSTTTSEEDHPVLPLFWCNNQEFDVDGGCGICSGSNFGTDYYFCVECDRILHKECVQSPFKIKHPYHPEHFLQLSYRDPSAPDIKCLCCGRIATNLVYYCTICDVVEIDGKLSQLVYHHPKYQPIPQSQSLTAPFDEAVNNDLFFCPMARCLKDGTDRKIHPLISSPDYVASTISTHRGIDHSILPLYWCNNKEFDANGGCHICSDSNFGIDYYFCELCDGIYHKECVESPFIIKRPYHPEHSLQLSYRKSDAPDIECFCCGRGAKVMVHCCTKCEAVMHPICAMKSISFVVDQPKRHDHPLTLFPEQASLTCNICGLIRKNYPTYVCLRCRFVAHNDCMYSPSIIKISRHHHRISYASSLQYEEWSCGVCRKSIDGNYGAYRCDKCDDYAVHVRCAVRKDVWDGVELEGVPEEDDITQDVGPFKVISEGVILHFLHDHHLRLEVSILYDENKLCEACVMPIFEGSFYSCTECKFIVHETCAQSPRKIQHALHPHPLTLKVASRYEHDFFCCDACDRICAGFVYECHVGECTFDLDVRCASTSEPFAFQGHKHLLFLALHPDVKPVCEVCEVECHKQFNCIKCDFIVCIKCATLPYKARYKHDKHFLTILWGEEVCEKDWCEICERNLRDTDTTLFYWCNDCCTTLHIDCLFDDEPYVKPGLLLRADGKDIKVLGKRNLSRPLCDSCQYPCQGRIYMTAIGRACSFTCTANLYAG